MAAEVTVEEKEPSGPRRTFVCGAAVLMFCWSCLNVFPLTLLKECVTSAGDKRALGKLECHRLARHCTWPACPGQSCSPVPFTGSDGAGTRTACKEEVVEGGLGSRKKGSMEQRPIREQTGGGRVGTASGGSCAGWSASGSVPRGHVGLLQLCSRANALLTVFLDCCWFRFIYSILPRKCDFFFVMFPYSALYSNTDF